MSNPETTVTTAAAVGGFRLSPQQRRGWRVQQQGEGPWTVLRALRLEGPADPSAVEAALSRVVARHEILRTAFRTVPGLGMPLQEPLDGPPEESAPSLVEGAGAEGATRLPEAVRDRIAGEVRRAVAEGRPALCAHWLASAGGDPLLVLAASTLCADRPGLERVVRELAAELAGEVGDGGEEPVQYADLAEWQNDLVDSEEGERERGLWRRLDLDAATSLRLPFEMEPEASATLARPAFAPAVTALDLDADLAAACRRRAAAAGASREDLLLACWGLLLGRLTGEPSPVLGVVVEGREYEGLDAVPGPLSRVVPLSLPLDEAGSRRRLVERAREALEEVRGVQEYWSWEAAGPAGGAAGDLPLLPVVFEVRPDLPPLAAGPARLVPVAEESCFEPFTLRLVVRSGLHRGAERLRLELHHDPRRVEADDARRTLEQLARVVTQVAAGGAGSTVAEVDVLAPGEHRLLEESSRPPVEGSAEPRLHRRFAAAAARHPQRRALVGEGGATLSYGELRARSAARARGLRERGIGPGDRVGLCFDRTPDMVVAMLAVLEAGAAYVPFDPAQPELRLTAMLETSGARLLLTTRVLREVVPDGVVDVLCVDAGPGSEADPADFDPAALDAAGGEPRPEDLAYVLFTSGSTGEPKGVAVEHRQLAAYVDGVVERLGLGEGGTFATVSTIAADLGNTMVFPALTTGGCLHLVPSREVADPESFAAWSDSHPADYLKIVPSHLQALLTATDPGRVLPRRGLVLGGEAFPWDLASRLAELAPGVAVFNHYGPTETTVGVLAAPVPAAPGRAATVPLGQPLAHARVYLVDRRLRPVPTWVPGEIVVGGAGVARGYLGQPGRTAECFLPDPFGTPGSRLYRTGDRARRLPDGGLEFLGRLDGQVKIRGFRVESGEIETLLRRHDGVREAVVGVREEDGGEPRLVAWLVPAGQEVPVPELRAFLAQRLPEAMLPAAFVSLKALPLTPNGKVDRRSLPAPDTLRPELAAEYVPPGSEVERRVAALWQDVLGLDRVGLHDNFFDLGGHSLLLVQVAAGLRETFGRDISMVELFRRTTVASLVAWLREDGGTDGGSDGGDGAEGRSRAETRQESLKRQRELRRKRRTAVSG